MGYLIVICISIVVSCVWGYLIIKAHEEDPNHLYKGKDLFGEEDKEDVDYRG